MLKKIILFVVIIGFFTTCTRDDLCPAGTATTPNLIITFNNYENENQRKSVEGLSIETKELEPRQVLNRTTTDSIALPLNINTDNTAYRFIKTTFTETDTITAIEEIRFLYIKKDIYVNRACGFRAEFGDLQIQQENTIGEPWIQKINIKRDSIVDETKAHIVIFH